LIKQMKNARILFFLGLRGLVCNRLWRELRLRLNLKPTGVRA
jgi:hypothetical protein